MTEDDFWEVVDRVHLASKGNMDAKCKLLETELRRLSADEVKSFDEYFSHNWHLAYTWALWDAASIIRGGCSDDGFMDFRSTLISMGRTIFEQALANPESLAELDLTPDTACYEGYQYVGARIYEEKAGREMPRSKPHPKRPKGTKTKEREISKRFPKLAAKYGYEGPEWSYEEQEKLRRNKKFRYTLGTGNEEVAARKILRDLLLDSGIIPPCGFIPPFRVVAEVLKQGQFIAANGVRCSWESFQLDEGDYWMAVTRLEELSAKELQGQKTILGAKIQLDIKTPASSDYVEWLQSLKQRGMA